MGDLRKTQGGDLMSQRPSMLRNAISVKFSVGNSRLAHDDVPTIRLDEAPSSLLSMSENETCSSLSGALEILKYPYLEESTVAGD